MKMHRISSVLSICFFCSLVFRTVSSSSTPPADYNDSGRPQTSSEFKRLWEKFSKHYNSKRLYGIDGIVDDLLSKRDIRLQLSALGKRSGFNKSETREIMALYEESPDFFHKSVILPLLYYSKSTSGVRDFLIKHLMSDRTKEVSGNGLLPSNISRLLILKGFGTDELAKKAIYDWLSYLAKNTYNLDTDSLELKHKISLGWYYQRKPSDRDVTIEDVLPSGRKTEPRTK